MYNKIVYQYIKSDHMQCCLITNAVDKIITNVVVNKIITNVVKNKIITNVVKNKIITNVLKNKIITNVVLRTNKE